MFTYPSFWLNSSREYIRLLTLLPGTQSKWILRVVTLEQAFNELSYTALSYTWGTEPATHAIEIRQEPGRYEPLHPKYHFLVRPNLYAFLQHWSSYCATSAKVPSHLWIDAICIDQNNTIERSEQVQLTKKIYSRANQVVIWLGDMQAIGKVSCTMSKLVQEITSFTEDRSFRGDRPSPISIETMEKTLSVSAEEIRSGVSLICDHPYFSRLWPVQEVCLAKKLYLLLGDQRVPWKIWRTVLMLPSCRNVSAHESARQMVDWALRVGKSRRDFERTRASRDYSRTAAVWRDYVPSSPLRSGRRNLFHRFDDIPSESKATFPELLHAFKSKGCADSRDRVFGLLGMARYGDKFPVDYSVEAVSLFWKAYQYFNIGLDYPQLQPFAEDLAEALELCGDHVPVITWQAFSAAGAQLSHASTMLKACLAPDLCEEGAHCSALASTWSMSPLHLPQESTTFVRHGAMSLILPNKPQLQEATLWTCLCEHCQSGSIRQRDSLRIKSHDVSKDRASFVVRRLLLLPAKPHSPCSLVFLRWHPKSECYEAVMILPNT